MNLDLCLKLCLVGVLEFEGIGSGKSVLPYRLAEGPNGRWYRPTSIHFRTPGRSFTLSLSTLLSFNTVIYSDCFKHIKQAEGVWKQAEGVWKQAGRSHLNKRQTAGGGWCHIV